MVYDPGLSHMSLLKILLVLAICAPAIIARQTPVSSRGQTKSRHENPATRKPATLIDAEGLARSATIYRDTYGVPHVFGSTDASTVFGFAYAQAEDNFWRVEENFI